MMPNSVQKSDPAVRWANNAALALLPVLACFLGGATEKWAEGIVIALLGLFLLVRPPRVLPRRGDEHCVFCAHCFGDARFFACALFFSVDMARGHDQRFRNLTAAHVDARNRGSRPVA